MRSKGFAQLEVANRKSKSAWITNRTVSCSAYLTPSSIYSLVETTSAASRRGRNVAVISCLAMSIAVYA
jgi:hypothetical protein